MAVRPCGHRLLVKPTALEDHDEVFKKAKSAGIQFLDKDVRAEQSAVDTGEVLSIGPTAFKDFGGDPWCKVGDTVVYARHSGKRIKDGETEYLALNDEDIVAVME